MKKIVFILIVVSNFAFLSCSKDDDQPNDNLNKKLKSISFNSNSTTTQAFFNYDSNGKWKSGKDKFGNDYNITYNGSGDILQFNIPSQGSSTVDYEYDAVNKLNGIIVDIYEIDFIYNNFRVTELEFYDPNILNRLKFTYDTSNRIKTITSEDDLLRWEYTYDNLNRIININVYSATNSSEPYIFTQYSVYEYENHKNPIYQLFNEQLNQGQILYSPIDIFPRSSRIFAWNIGVEISILPEYNIKSIKEYLVSNPNVPRREINMSYTIVDNKVQSFLNTTNFSGNITTEQVVFSYE